MTGSGITVPPTARAGFVWRSNAAILRAVRATAGDQTIEESGSTTAAGPISLSRGAATETMTGIGTGIGTVIAIEIMTVMDTAATMGVVVDKSFRALRTTCTNIIARRTRAAECNWSSKTATHHAAREKAGDTIAGAFGSIMDAVRIFRSAVRFDSA